VLNVLLDGQGGGAEEVPQPPQRQVDHGRLNIHSLLPIMIEDGDGDAITGNSCRLEGNVDRTSAEERLATEVGGGSSGAGTDSQTWSKEMHQWDETASNAEVMTVLPTRMPCEMILSSPNERIGSHFRAGSVISIFSTLNLQRPRSWRIATI